MATFFKNDETGKFLAAVDADMFAPAGYTEVAANSVDVKTGIVYAYCNLHGLWKAEF